MTNMLTITIVGTKPRAQPRPRFFFRGGRAVVVSTASQSNKAWSDAVAIAARDAIEGKDRLIAAFHDGAAVDATITFQTRDKKRWGKPHTSRPDRDNLDKAILDALVRAGVLPDDAVVADGRIIKLWGGEHRVDIYVRALGTDPLPWRGMTCGGDHRREQNVV